MTHPTATTATPTVRDELRALLRLALPVVGVQVGIMLMGVVDTVMVGRLSAEALAAVALGNVYFWQVSIFGMGVLMALDPIVAQAVGARDEPAIARGVQRGLLIALLLTVLTSALMVPGEPLLALARQPASIIPTAARYARACIPGVLPFFVFIVLRQTLQAMGRMRAIVAVVALANVANVGFNWMLIYGELGAPALGAVGSGWATTASRWLMAVGLLAAAWPALRPHLVPWRRETLAWAPLGRMLRLALPIGGQFQLEYMAFGVIALLMGGLGEAVIAGHQVAINLAALTYMVPAGVAGAAAVLVGRCVGRGDAAAARRAAAVALACGAAFMVASGLVMLAAPGPLARAYTPDAAVLAVATALIPIAGLFQLFDGLQVVAAGILRGAGDTRAPFLLNLLGFWLVGMPVSLYLAYRTGLGATGLWWGFVAGLGAVAVLLLARVRGRLGRPVARVAVDATEAPAER